MTQSIIKLKLESTLNRYWSQGILLRQRTRSLGKALAISNLRSLKFKGLSERAFWRRMASDPIQLKDKLSKFNLMRWHHQINHLCIHQTLRKEELSCFLRVKWAIIIHRLRPQEWDIQSIWGPKYSPGEKCRLIMLIRTSRIRKTCLWIDC